MINFFNTCTCTLFFKDFQNFTPTSISLIITNVNNVTIGWNTSICQHRLHNKAFSYSLTTSTVTCWQNNKEWLHSLHWNKHPELYLDTETDTHIKQETFFCTAISGISSLLWNFMVMQTVSSQIQQKQVTTNEDIDCTIAARDALQML